MYDYEKSEWKHEQDRKDKYNNFKVIFILLLLAFITWNILSAKAGEVVSPSEVYEVRNITIGE